MISTLKNLLDRAAGIKNEVVSLANTALRIGQFLLDLARSGVHEYDPLASYVAGQWVIYNDVLTKVEESAAANQTPISHPAKYSIKLVLDPTQATLSNKLPISASAVRALINQVVLDGDGAPNADTTKRGIVRQSTDAEFNAGTNNDTFVTPKQVKVVQTGFSNALTNLATDLGSKNLDDVIGYGDETNKPPYFFGGLFATLLDVPSGLSTLNVVVDPNNGKLYKVASNEPGTIIDFVIDGHFEEQAAAASVTIELSNSDFVADGANLVQRLFGGFTLIGAGQTGNWYITNRYSSGPDDQYTGAGTYSIPTPKRSGLVLTAGSGATATLQNPVSYLGNSIIKPAFTFPSGGGGPVSENVTLKGFIPAIDYEVIPGSGAYQVLFYVACPPDWEEWPNYPLSGVDANGFAYGAGSGPHAVGTVKTITLSNGAGFSVTKSITVAGAQSRTNLWKADNLALAPAYATTASASSALADRLPGRAIDGNVVDFSNAIWWHSAAISGTPNEHLDINLGLYRSCSRVVIHMVPDDWGSRNSALADNETFTLYGIVAFRIQCTDGAGGWTTLQTVTGNNKCKRTVTFPATITNLIRVQVDGLVSGDTNARIMEVEIFEN